MRYFYKILILQIFSGFVTPVFAQTPTDSLHLTGTASDSVIAKQYFVDALKHYEKQKYKESVLLLLKAKNIIEPVLGTENMLYFNILEQLIPSYFFAQKQEEAESSTNEYLALANKMFGENHISIVTAHRYLGIMNQARDKFDEAIKQYNLALDVSSKLSEKDQAMAFKIYNLLGKLYDKTGKNTEALVAFQKAKEGCISYSNGQPFKCAYIITSLAGLYTELDSIEKSNQYLLDLIDLYSEQSNSKEDLIKVMDELGRNYLKMSLPDSAIALHQRSLKIQKDFFDNINSPEKAFSLNALGLCYFEKGDYTKALYYADESLKIRQNLGLNNKLGVAFCFTNIGNCYFVIGDYEKALQYYFSALDIEKRVPNYDPGELGKSYNNIGLAYRELSEFDKAIIYLEEALKSWLSAYGENHTAVAYAYNNLGIVYQSKGDSELAIKYKEKAFSIYSRIRGEESLNVGSYYLNIGNSFVANLAFEKAKEKYEKGYAILLKNMGETHPYIATASNALGDVYSNLGDFEKSKLYYQKALYANRYRSDGAFESVMDMIQLMETFRKYGHLCISQYQLSLDTTWLFLAHDLSVQATKAVVYQFKTLLSGSSKADLLQSGLSITENAIQIHQMVQLIKNTKKNADESFISTERVKALMLLESLRENDARAFAGIPKELLEQEHNLRIDIAYLEKKRFDAENTGAEASKNFTTNHNSSLLQLKRDYDALKQRLETDYPEYYRLKYDLSTVSLPYVQDTLLQPKQTLLEYFVGDSSLYLFVVRPDTFAVWQVKRDFPLEDWIEQFRHGLYGYYTTPQSQQNDALYNKCLDQYLEFGPKLYQKLIAPVQALLREQVILVPDGPLGYIPFDALLTGAPKDETDLAHYPYLMNQHQFSYTYSATLLREMRDKKHHHEPSKEFVAFAPFYNGDTTLLGTMYSYDALMRKDLQPLTYSGPEVAAASKIMRGEKIVGTAATEARFTSTAGNYRILHLATHGRADNRVGDYAFLAFTEIKDSIENELLYVKDLYNLELNADLVVLSACETGIGKLQRGEGIISLARAFAYAGAKSIVTTLWEVNDKSTSELMRFFYRELRLGKSKDAALRLARQRYLKESSVELCHPFFWAAFVPIGDMERLR